MSKIKIITDASAALPESIFQKNNIGIVNLKIIWPEEAIDGDLFKKMRSTLTNTSPKTSQPSVGDFKKAFENALETYNEIICITISTVTSGTYNSAMQAIKFLPKEKLGLAKVDNAMSKELPIYDKKIIDTDLSVRAKNCLISCDVFTVGDLCALNGIELKRWRNLGRKTHKDIIDFMNENKVNFGRL